MEISLERSGVFQADTMRVNAHKCAAMRTKRYPWHVMIDATDKKLSPEGFIIDNAQVAEYFDTRWGHKAQPWDALSCEMLALTSARELCRMLVRQGVSVERVTVRIGGSNGAWLSATCTPEQIN